MTEVVHADGSRASGSRSAVRRTASTRQYLASLPFIGPAWILVLIVGIIPLGYAVWLAFTNQSITAVNHNFVGFKNFAATITRPDFLNSLVTTAIFVVACTVVEFVVGYALAHFLSQELRGHQLARSILLIPMLLTPVVIGLVFKFMFQPQVGIISELLAGVGVGVPWFTDAFWGRVFVVVLDSWLFIPFVMLMVLAGLAGVSKDELEAASLDGAGWWAKTRYVTLPALRSVLTVTLLLRIVDTARIFDQVYSSTRGGPGTSTLTVSVLIYQNTFGYYQFGYGAAMALTLTVLLSPVYFFYIRMTRI